MQSIHFGFSQGQAHSKTDTKQKKKKLESWGEEVGLGEGGVGWGRSARKLVSMAVMFAIFSPLAVVVYYLWYCWNDPVYGMAEGICVSVLA